MNRTLKVICLSILLMLPARTTFSVVEDDIRFEHLSVEQGLSRAVVYSILQDSLGFMWFGLEGGLNRYDGSAFKVYEPDPDNPNSLSDSAVYSLYEDRRGNLWIGTRNGGLNRFDPRTETFTRYRHDPKNPASLSHDSLRFSSMWEDADGILWVSTQGGGLNRFDPAGETFAHFRHDPNNPESLSSDLLAQICPDPEDGRILWVGTMGGLDRFDTVSGKALHFRHDAQNPHTLSSNNVRVIRAFPETGKVLWVGTASGLNRFDPSTGTAVRFQHDADNPNSLSHNDIYDICNAGDGTLWVSTHSGGLNRFDPVAGAFTRYRHDPGNPRSLSNGTVHPLLRDRTGALWVGTWGGGVDRFAPGHPKFLTYRHSAGTSKGLSHSSIFGMIQDRNGIIWIATNGGGLNQFDPNTETFTHYRHDPDNLQSLSHDTVFTLYEDRRGAMWVGTWGGLDRFDRESGAFIHYLHDDRDPTSLSHNGVRAITEDRQGNLWIGTTNGGVDRFNPDVGLFIHHQHDPGNPRSLISNNVWSLFRDGNDTLWVGTGSGLDRFDPASKGFIHYQHDPNDSSSLSDNVVLNYLEDRDGFLWLATQMGLNRFDRATGKSIHYFEKQGLPHNTVESILEDNHGNFWLATDKGISRFNPQNGTFRYYDVADGLQGNQFYYPAFLKDREGNLYFGGPSGLSVFHPDKLRDNPHMPPVVLTDFQLSNRTVPVGADSVLKESIGFTKEVVLSHDQSGFGFKFAALNYTAPQKNQYAYILEGFDREWILTNSSRRFANYTNIDPGEYTFRVKASNNDGKWNEQGASVRIVVQPAWWETWWFKGMVLFMLASLLLGGFRLRMGIVKARARELEHQVAERTAQLQESERAKSTLLGNLPGIAYRCQNDENWTMEFMSEGCVKLTGYPAEDFIQNQRLAFGEIMCPEDVQHVWQSVQIALQERRPYELTYRIETATGEEKWVWQRGAGVFSASGELLALEGFINDITDRKRAEAEQIKLERHLQQARKSESLGRMAGAIAHHFNNKLMAIMGNLELALLHAGTNESLSNWLLEAQRASIQAAEVSSLMLAYLGQALAKAETVDLAQVCRETIETQRSFIPKRVRLKMDIPPQGPTIKANQAQARQTLSNLIVNACEAIGNGEGDVHVSLRVVKATEMSSLHIFPADWRPEKESYACLEVSDSGSGINPEQLDLIFDPFFSTRFTGRGLGLAVVLGTVRSHGGAVAVESEPGRGSIFRVFWPVAEPETQVFQTLETGIPGWVEDLGLILFVDDDAQLRNLAQLTLQHMGFRVIQAAHGLEALEIFRDRKDEINLVILDLTMPKMDGWETLEGLRALQPDIRVILVSGYDEAMVMEGKRAELPQAFLHKPYSMAELKRALGAVMGMSAGENAKGE